MSHKMFLHGAKSARNTPLVFALHALEKGSCAFVSAAHLRAKNIQGVVCVFDGRGKKKGLLMCS
jgi:hypothetical protein